MLTPDHINGAFEFVGSLLTWGNAVRVYKDRGYAGIYLPATVFFFFWGLWNLFYYPSLRQWWSFVGGASLVLANYVWVFAMIHYGRKH